MAVVGQRERRRKGKSTSFLALLPPRRFSKCQTFWVEMGSHLIHSPPFLPFSTTILTNFHAIIRQILGLQIIFPAIEQVHRQAMIIGLSELSKGISQHKVCTEQT